jgi:hypothetical protein
MSAQTDDEAVPVRDSIQKWTLVDAGRVAQTVIANEDGRWMAMADMQGR